MPARAVLHANHAPHQQQYMAALKQGLERHGIEAAAGEFDKPSDADFAVVWGWRQKNVINHCRSRKMPLLVMERGHLQPRMEFASMGWGGLGRRGVFPDASVVEGRWRKHWGTLADWNDDGRYVLIIGQVSGDASIEGMNFEQWAQQAADWFAARLHGVVYRPHPAMTRAGKTWTPRGIIRSHNSLEHDLAGAKLCVVWNSTACVEAALAGVPVIACDEGAMAWDIAGRELAETGPKPDRQSWVEWLAGCQWNESEIRTGEAWAAVETAMEASCPG